MRKKSGKPSSPVLGTLKKLQLLRFRGNRGGLRKNVQHLKERTIQNISVVIGRRAESGFAIPRLRVEKRRNPSNLVSVPKQVVSREHTSVSSGQLAVPKLLLINICSLGKTTSRVRAVVALEADLRNNDIDACVVSETHLKIEVPDTVVNISGYNIFRRDRNWSGCDLRNGGGVAIYTRSNLSVIDVYRSNLYEFICLTVLLPSGNYILLSGLYHPPKTSYQQCDLMDYLLNFFDTMLDNHPNATIVCGGDLNHLDLTRLKRITGWTALVDFPTRGDSFLDNCLTNRPELFGKALSIKMLIKTDHIGFIVPAGKKLKPIRKKVQFRDCREHRKQALYLALASECWDDVLEADSIETAVNILELKILSNINWCMPLRTVSLSSRDPSWMTPLVKYMLRSKSHISVLRTNKHRELSRNVLKVIGENRRMLLEGKMGSREWWKNVDLISQRRRSTNVSLDRETAQDLNEYFGDLCTDGDYVEPALLEIGPEVKVPEISERYVWNSLSTLKKTATGPDQIPYWVWKDHAEIFTPIITKLWNLSLATHQWPRSWKGASINPLPKVDVPVARGDFRGINVTPVIARALEKAVYKIHAQKPVEEQLLNSQFAYREGGSCTDALLLIQNKICKFLDDPKCKAVRMFAMDFSKAFDSVSHKLLAEKLKSLPLNPYIINWWLGFLRDRKQRVIFGNHVCNWKTVNKGTTQGSVSGPYLFNIFLNDLEIKLGNETLGFKYADDCTIIATVYYYKDHSVDLINQFLQWASQNRMNSNSTKCKELIMYKKGHTAEAYKSIFGIPQTSTITILGLTFQPNCKFSTHLKEKLGKANKCLYVIRCLRKEGCSQAEVDVLFNSLVLPNITYALSVHGASESELTIAQQFLDRCFKRSYISKKLVIGDLLKTQDHKICRKVSTILSHPLRAYFPETKITRYNLRNKSPVMPAIRTNRFKNTFFNRIVFKYNVAL